MDAGAGKFVTDYMGNYDDAEITGGEWGEGRFGRALSFDGSDAHAQVPFSPEFHMFNQKTLLEITSMECASFLAQC